MIRFVNKRYNLHRTPEYIEWLSKQTDKAQAQIAERLSKIELEGYFGDHHIDELRWKNGRRLYYAYLAEIRYIITSWGQ